MIPFTVERVKKDNDPLSCTFATASPATILVSDLMQISVEKWIYVLGHSSSSGDPETAGYTCWRRRKVQECNRSSTRIRQSIQREYTPSGSGQGKYMIFNSIIIEYGHHDVFHERPQIFCLSSTSAKRLLTLNHMERIVEKKWLLNTALTKNWSANGNLTLK